MNIYFLDFRDPLFSIIIFFVLIFIITFVSYWWGRYRRKEDNKHLDKFLQQFRALPTQDELKELVSRGELSRQSWMLLAASYSKNGNYEKCIEIYNEILKQEDKASKNEILYLLGKTYYRAGFLVRSKQIILELLRKNPRTPKALETLLLIYESMKEYSLALETLEPLKALGKDVQSEKLYLQALELLSDVNMSQEQKVDKLIALYIPHRSLPYMLVEYLFKVAPTSAWKYFDSSRAEHLVDILWRLPKEDIDLDYIEQNRYLRELYTARGDINLSRESSVFEFDVLIHLQGETNASLAFEYICTSCKQFSPFAFYRCSACHTIDSVSIEYNLIKNYHRDFSEESNSFQ